MPGDPQPARLQVLEFLRKLRRHWKLITICTAAAALIGAVSSAVGTTEYEARADVLVREYPVERIVADVVGGAEAPVRLGDIESFTREALRERRRAGRPVEATIDPDLNTNVVGVLVVSDSANDAVTQANELADTVVEKGRQKGEAAAAGAEEILQRRLDTLDADLLALGPTASEQAQDVTRERRDLVARGLEQLSLARELDRLGSAEVLNVATEASPQGRGATSPVRTGLVAGVVGLLLGLGVAVLREQFDPRVRGEAELVEASGDLPVVASIPRLPRTATTNGAVTVAGVPHSATAEAYRYLRTAVQHVAAETKLGSLLVTSPNGREGKTTTVANLGVALARAGLEVAVVDADLRSSGVHEIFHLDPTPGLAGVVRGEVELRDALRTVADTPGLFVLPAGEAGTAPSELLALPEVAATFQSLAADVDLVLVDSPPVIPVTDAVILSGLTDAALLVVAAGVTDGRDLAQALALLAQVDARVLGTVLNEPALRRRMAPFLAGS